MEHILLGFCSLNFALIAFLYLGLRRRPKEVKNTQGKILVHKFVTKKIKK